MKTIKGDLILNKDTKFNESIKVEGDIKGYYNLVVRGNIICRNIDCLDIDCLDINCRDINCRNINCWDINCRDITCWNIIYCNKIKLKNKCIAKNLIKNRYKLKRKEWEV